MHIRPKLGSIQVLSVISIFALALTACGATSASPKKATTPPSHALSIEDVGGAWPTLDPAQGKAETTEQPIFDAIYGSLFQLTPKGAPVPDLATGYTVSKSGKSVTITLRSNLKFSNGTPLTAAVVKYNILRYQKSACLCASFLTSISGVSTPNATTVVLTLSHPDSSIIAALASSQATYMVPPTVVAKEGANFGNAPIGAGPFTVLTNVPSTKLVLKRSTTYWDARATKLPEVTFIASTSSQTALSSVESGVAQLAWNQLDVTTLQSAKSNSSVKLVSLPSQYYFDIEPNMLNGPFKGNPLKAQAVFDAINPKALESAIEYNDSNVTNDFYATDMSPNIGLTDPNDPIHYDPARSKALVKSLGGISFTMETIFNTPIYVEFADALKAEWTAVGINATIDVATHAAAVSTLINGSFQAMLNIYGNYTDPLLAELTLFQCHATINAGYCNTKADNLMSQIEATSNTATQIRLYHELATLVQETGGYYPMVTGANGVVEAKSVSGIPASSFLYLETAYVG